MEQKPIRYKPRFYSTVITFPADPGPTVPIGRDASGSFSIVNVPFIVKRISSQIVGDPQAPGVNPAISLYNHTIEFRTDQHNFQNEPMMAGAFHGFPDGYMDLPCPCELAPKDTISVRIVNTLVRADTIRIQVVFAGVEPIVEPRGT